MLRGAGDYLVLENKSSKYLRMSLIYFLGVVFESVLVTTLIFFVLLLFYLFFCAVSMFCVFLYFQKNVRTGGLKQCNKHISLDLQN